MRLLIVLALFSSINCSHTVLDSSFVTLLNQMKKEEILNGAKRSLLDCIKLSKGNLGLEKECLLAVFNNDFWF